MRKLYLFGFTFLLLFSSFGLVSAAALTPNSYQVTPVNFQDYPEAFDGTNAIMAWDLDIIDIDVLQIEHPDVTGEGVYVAVLDTGLKKNWRDYFPEERIKTEWGRSFIDVGIMQDEKAGKYKSKIIESKDFHGEHPHGTHVTSTIIGYGFYGTPIQGVAPHATIIPVKVLDTYEGLGETFGTSEAVAAGIDYITELAQEHPESRFVISMSLGALAPIDEVEKVAIDKAIAAGVIIVAAAGNEGTAGMDSPGSYAPVISVGASGWASWTPVYGYYGEWTAPSPWWIANVPEDNTYVSYIADFSGREFNSLQELDIIAPGTWVVGPYPVGPGQSHLPWWSNGIGNGVGGQYYYVGGTSMAVPHVSGVVALMLQVDDTLQQADVETILRGTTDFIPFAGGQWVVDPFTGGFNYIEWGYDGLDAIGWGLLQADAAIAAVI
jgi:subtilisin family serine protease